MPNRPNKTAAIIMKELRLVGLNMGSTDLTFVKKEIHCMKTCFTFPLL